jgi:hypothetical protein
VKTGLLAKDPLPQAPCGRNRPITCLSYIAAGVPFVTPRDEDLASIPLWRLGNDQIQVPDQIALGTLYGWHATDRN